MHVRVIARNEVYPLNGVGHLEAETNRGASPLHALEQRWLRAERDTAVFFPCRETSILLHDIPRSLLVGEVGGGLSGAESTVPEDLVPRASPDHEKI